MAGKIKRELNDPYQFDVVSSPTSGGNVFVRGGFLFPEVNGSLRINRIPDKDMPAPPDSLSYVYIKSASTMEAEIVIGKSEGEFPLDSIILAEVLTKGQDVVSIKGRKPAFLSAHRRADK